MKKLFSFALATLMLLSCFSLTTLAQPTGSANKNVDDYENFKKVTFNQHIEYATFLEQHKDAKKGVNEIEINASHLTSSTIKESELNSDNSTSAVVLYDGKSDKYKKSEGKSYDSVIYTGESAQTTFRFKANEGLYNIYFEYFTEKGKNISVERSVEVNGKVPYDVAEGINLNRVWTDQRPDYTADISADTNDAAASKLNGYFEKHKKYNERSSYYFKYLAFFKSAYEQASEEVLTIAKEKYNIGKAEYNKTVEHYNEYYSPFASDDYGNNVRPTQVEMFEWTGTYFYDYLGYNIEPLQFHFNEGWNTISIKSVKEPVTIGSIKLVPIKSQVSYKDYLANAKSNGVQDYSGEEKIIEAEFALTKSDQTLYPTTDVSSASTVSNGNTTDAYLQRINMIGGLNWEYMQQSISWEVGDIPEGLYAINLKTRQNVTQGSISSRKLLVNNELPFDEVKQIAVRYSKDWAMVTPTTKDGEQCLIHLKAGDIITLETTLGEMGIYLQKADKTLSNINEIYRKILMITGSSPDLNRDYLLNELIPDVIADMKTQADSLDKIVEEVLKISGDKGSNLYSLETVSRQLRQMNKDPDIISKQLKYFKTNIGSLGNWLNGASLVPLELDYISLSAPKSEIKKPTVNFFKRLGYNVSRFIASFTVDYNAIGTQTDMVQDSDKDNDVITVWLASGRDQFQILRTLINNSYTAQTGKQVNLELVNAGALLSAVVAGIGPDVILDQLSNEPVNFALRNAIYNLSDFEDKDPEFQEVLNRFDSEALKAYYFDSKGDGSDVGLYALPEKQDFTVMYYRKDILSQLGLDIPQTWTDVISTVTVLNKNNMEFGLPSTMQTFYAMLLQQGGDMYTKNGTATNLKADSATQAFKLWTNFFVNYDLPLTYDFQNRFRTGEMPLGIASFTLYNTLSVSAPEIRGLWGYTLVPGTKQEDGTIDRSNTLSTSCAFILKQNINPDLSWQFLKWWTTAQTQTAYGTQIESVLGPSARYNPANNESFNSLPWSAEDLKVLNKERSLSYQMPQIAGSYFIERHINNAFRRVIYKDKDEKDTLFDYARIIDAEIKNKREEFGLINKEN